jgi:hypothetical protein
MPNSYIDIYDQDASPAEQTLVDDRYNRAPAVVDGVLWCGTAAIADNTTYRLELRTSGQIPVYGLSLFPNPSTVAAIQLDDASAFVSSIIGHPSGNIFFAVKAATAANTKVYKYALPDLAADDAAAAADLPLLGVLKEELVATYNDLIRVRTGAGVWGSATVTPTPTTYRIKGIHTFLDNVFFLVDANYIGVRKAEVWKYTGNAAAVTLDQSYTGTTFAQWNATYTAGGQYDSELYGSWNDSDTTHTLVKRGASSWSTAKAALQVGEVYEFRGAIYGHFDTTLKSPGSDETGTWSTISSAFPADLVTY